ncbi:MAG: DUF3786 domain-containing protein [Candidatus Thorarchaeota archaeon]|jgi:hypothetical protein
MADDILDYWNAVAPRELASKYLDSEVEKMWTWDNLKEDIQTLKNKHGASTDYLDLLGFRVNLVTGKTKDLLTGELKNTDRLVTFLYYYSKAKDEGVANDWVKFSTLKGSWACRHSFDEQDLAGVLEAYVKHEDKLFETLERLGAERIDHGDAAFVLSFLPMVKVLLVFEAQDEEFPASVRMLFDRNSIFYQPHEMLGSVGWMVASRVLKLI